MGVRGWGLGVREEAVFQSVWALMFLYLFPEGRGANSLSCLASLMSHPGTLVESAVFPLSQTSVDSLLYSAPSCEYSRRLNIRKDGLLPFLFRFLQQFLLKEAKVVAPSVRRMHRSGPGSDLVLQVIQSRAGGSQACSLTSRLTLHQQVAQVRR